MSISNPKVGFVSLGCPKAGSDAERILTQLRAEGYEISGSYEDADLVVVNTCGFIDSAVEESLDAIGEAIKKNGKVIVTGCLGAKKGVVEAAHPSVLAVTGPHALEEVMIAVHANLPKLHEPFIDLVPPQGIRLTPSHYAYLKISEGCNHRCSFCIIPSMRGDLVSRPIGEVMNEAENLVNAGVSEILVISQDTSAYGVDVKYRPGFWNGRPVRTRMFQHASPGILKAMKRPAHAENNLARIKAWREICPDITVRSTFIAGFPGETEDDFKMLLDFLEEAQLDRVGCFTYSAVDGAKANELPDHVPEEVKQERLARFMEVQERISAAKLQTKIGTMQTVLVDEINQLEDGSFEAIGRTKADAPEIDGVVYLDDAEGLSPGDFVEVQITKADGHDLWGGPPRD